MNVSLFTNADIALAQWVEPSLRDAAVTLMFLTTLICCGRSFHKLAAAQLQVRSPKDFMRIVGSSDYPFVKRSAF